VRDNIANRQESGDIHNNHKNAVNESTTIKWSSILSLKPITYETTIYYTDENVIKLLMVCTIATAKRDSGLSPQLA